MKITTYQVEMVQQSWEKLKPSMQVAGELFYQKLFEKAPQLRHLFKEDVKEQAGKLGYMLNYVVTRLDKLDTILKDVKNLAIRHNKYGAEPEHYITVGKCLLETLEEALGDDWSIQLKQAWTSAYVILSDTMIQAQQEVTERRA